MTNEIRISIRAYAKQLKVDEAAVRSAIDTGKIKKGVVYVNRTVKGKKKKTPLIIATIANNEWGFKHHTPKAQRGLSKKKVAEKLSNDNSHQNKKENNNSEDDSDNDDEENLSYTELLKKINIHPELGYSEVLRRREIIGAAADKMKIEELQGTLVKRSEVEKALFAVGDELKKKLLSIPARCMEDILSAPNKVEANNILTFEINQVLISISQLQQTA